MYDPPWLSLPVPIPKILMRVSVRRMDPSTPLRSPFSLDSSQGTILVKRAGVFAILREHLSVLVGMIRFMLMRSDEPYRFHHAINSFTSVVSSTSSKRLSTEV
jgi:hypothetical protein